MCRWGRIALVGLAPILAAQVAAADPTPGYNHEIPKQIMTPDAASALFKAGLKIYPLAEAARPPAMEFISGSEKPFNTIHANDEAFYEELHEVIEREPLSMLDPELRGLFAAIGIQKGRPFEPDERMKAILADAVQVGNATARSTSISGRRPRPDGNRTGSRPFPARGGSSPCVSTDRPRPGSTGPGGRARS
jgi:hypothetical protein